MRIRIVMYGGVVTDVFVVAEQPDRPWLRLDEKFDYKIDQYPLEDLIEDKKGGSQVTPSGRSLEAVGLSRRFSFAPSCDREMRNSLYSCCL